MSDGFGWLTLFARQSLTDLKGSGITGITRACIALIAIGLAACTPAKPQATIYKLYYLGGQSNMEGFGFSEQLAAGQRFVSDNVMIFVGTPVLDDDPDGGVGLWDALQPGYGTGFRSDGTIMQRWNRFGPELSFGRSMAAAPGAAKIALVKYALSGSGLAAGVGFGSWDPDYRDGEGVNQYDNAVKTMRYAMSVDDIDGDGTPDRLVPSGIVWMQGEADAYHSQAAADEYLANLARIMGLLREALGASELPVVIGRITDSGMADDGSVMDYIGTVQDAQAALVTADACAAYVTVTDDLNYLSDGWHYDTDGFIRLGSAFAEAMTALEKQCAQAE